MSGHFAELPLRRLTRILGGGTPSTSPEFWNGDVPFATPKDLRLVSGSHLKSTERTLSPVGVVSGSTIAPRASVLLSIRAPIGYTVLLDEQVAFSQGCKALVPDTTRIIPAFLQFSLNNKTSALEAVANGTTFKELSATVLAEFPIKVPELGEQERIVRFLDAETAKIDHLITKQRELIDLTMLRLQVWRERSFWGGADYDPFFKPPDGWKVRRNRHIFEHVDGRTETGNEELLSVSHITGVTPRYMKNVTMFEAESTVGYKLVAKNELVINTMWAWMGALGVSKYEGIVSPAYDVYRFRDLDSVNPMFFDCMYRTAAYVRLMKANSRGIWESRLRLYPEVFLRLSSLVPPRDIQDRLVGENRKKTAEADNLVERCNKAISLLQERRSALITAAVTGQIEV